MEQEDARSDGGAKLPDETPSLMLSASASSSSSPLYPSSRDLPPLPTPAIVRNYEHFFVTDFMKEKHDQYVYRHKNGLCVVGLASTHIALDGNASITAVDFNVGKQSRTEMKVTGKRKKDAHILEPNSILCKLTSNDNVFIIRCCVKGALLEVNERLIKDPSLLKTKAASEGYIAIIMPRGGDWKKVSSSLLTAKEYEEKRPSQKVQDDVMGD